MITIPQSLSILKSINFQKIKIEELEEVLPSLGMNNECLDQMPNKFSEFYGEGIRFWQYPNQLSKLVKFISDIKIDTYLEIGCRWGGTFIIMNEVFKQTNPNLKSWACDLIPQSEVLSEYARQDDFKYININSQDPEFLNLIPKSIDFIFIDGDHSYEGVKKDYENALTLNPKYLMFHDISCKDMGVCQFWEEIKDKYEHFEFIDQYQLETIKHDMLGIGVIKIK